MSRPEILVQKFGGTSLGSPERIRSVADRIARVHRSGRPLVVVVSAMGHTTDELLQLARQVSAQPPGKEPGREIDMLLTAGERISMALLSIALADRGVPAVSLTGSQTGIITDESHRRARIKRILGGRVRESLAQGKVVIVAGFQGVSESKEVTTLGRGGSDTTAVALAAALGAAECEIYTDVDGVYSADPRWEQEARFLPVLPYDWMLEMASRGAKVLHPRSVEIAKKYGIVVHVKNSLKEESHRSTRIEAADIEALCLTGVTADQDQLLFAVDLARPSVLGALWEQIAKTRMAVTTPMFQDGKVWFFLERAALGELETHVHGLIRDGFVRDYKAYAEWIPLSVVGQSLSAEGNALYRVIDALARHHVQVLVGSASALAVTVAIPLTHAKEGVQALSAEFVSIPKEGECP